MSAKDDALHDLAFEFVKNLSWVLGSGGQKACDAAAESLVALIKASKR